MMTNLPEGLKRISAYLAGLATLVAGILLLFAWESLPSESYLALKLGRPTGILSVIARESALWQAASVSVERALLALALTAMLSAIVFAICVSFPLLTNAVLRFLVLLQPVPFTVIVLLVVICAAALTAALALGSERDTVATVLAVVSVTVLQPTANALGALDESRRELRLSLLIWRAPLTVRLWDVYFFEALPSWLVAMRVTSAWVTGSVLVAESMLPYDPSSPNLGRRLWQVVSQADISDRRGAAIVMASAAGLSVYFSVAIITRWVQAQLFGHRKRGTT